MPAKKKQARPQPCSWLMPRAGCPPPPSWPRAQAGARESRSEGARAGGFFAQRSSPPAFGKAALKPCHPQRSKSHSALPSRRAQRAELALRRGKRAPPKSPPCTKLVECPQCVPCPHKAGRPVLVALVVLCSLSQLPAQSGPRTARE